ncbi:helix-turn-helix transcriptional regulator [Methanosarcina sp. KYL-1]|uniref:winged helix-turn-helix transcriptional regulator n=1 Tax=Methanosarcina sp. KYL-1 TaxID=2602068 RepID=UPI0026F300DB|nr:helix-turn-helix domain-containing protein [Methanosarcina sp. KYL-1]MCQ1534627.1 helix-turn-helix transcriptional regulator [Methanosarcina sp. KYL-1]
MESENHTNNSNDNNKKYHCPVEATLDVIGGKWKPLILWQLREDTLRFSGLQQNMHGISPKMLTKQLRELEKDGLVLRKVYPEIPPKVEYSLTEFGKTVIPVLEALCRWGTEYLGRQCTLDKTSDNPVIIQ